MIKFSDGLQNIAAGLGDPARDKIAGVSWSTPTEYADTLWSSMYRDSWLAKRIVDAPADDATREWREWQADPDQISAIEALEIDLALADRLKECAILARLYGRAHLYFDLGDDPAEPLRADRVRRGGLRFVTVLSRREVADGIIQDDPMQPGYGYPAWYEVSSTSQGSVRVHPSRMVTLYGDTRPDDYVFGRRADSVLRGAKSAIEQHDATIANVAALVFEAKVDVWSIPGLNEILRDPVEEAAFLSAAQTANYLKGAHGMLMLEGGSENNKTTYAQKSMSFSTLPDIIEKMQDQVCAAAKYSKAYIFGQGTSGLGGSGKMELSMDYDKIEAIQKTKLQPAMRVLDEVIIRSALGSRPPEIHYNWRSLWQESDNDRAERIGKLATAFKAISDAQMWPQEVITQTSVNTMIETGGMPGLEAAWSEWSEGDQDLDNDIEEDE